MRITPKSLIQKMDPERILLFPKDKESSSMMAVHRSIIAHGIIPLRGNFDMLPGMLSTLSGIQAMGASLSKVAIIIDDDHLTHKALTEIKDLCEQRQFCSMKMDGDVSLLLHTQQSKNELKVLGDRLVPYSETVRDQGIEERYSCPSA